MQDPAASGQRRARTRRRTELLYRGMASGEVGLPVGGEKERKRKVKRHRGFMNQLHEIKIGFS